MKRQGSVLLVVLGLILIVLFLVGMVARFKGEQEYSQGSLKRSQDVESTAISATSYVIAKLSKDELKCTPSPCDTGSQIVLPSFGDVKVSGVIVKKFSTGGSDYYLIDITAQKKEAKRTVEFLYRK